MSVCEKHVPTLEDAIGFAVGVHRGQVRKGGTVPYIVHPVEVAAICSRLTDDPSVRMAGALHDAVEDAGATLAEIEERFGPRVAQIVAGVSENKRADRPAGETWQQRKQETIDALSGCDDMGILMVCLADKLSNMRSTALDLDVVGPGFWSRFNVSDPKMHAWYYGSIARALEPRLGSTREWRELDGLVREVFGEDAAEVESEHK